MNASVILRSEEMEKKELPSQVSRLVPNGSVSPYFRGVTRVNLG